jgi:hypothetical protein
MRAMKYSDETILKEAELIVDGASVRIVSWHLEIPPTTVWCHMRNTLKRIDMELWKKVDKVLKSHKN